MKTKDMLMSAALAGAIAAVLSTIPFVNLANCLLCAWMWAAGIFAVWLYNYLSGDSADTATGALLGLLTGVFGAVIATLLGVIFGSHTPIPPETMRQLEQTLGQSTAQMITSTTTSLFLGLIFNLLFYIIFGVIGGFIGTSIFKPKPSSGIVQ